MTLALQLALVLLVLGGGAMVFSGYAGSRLPQGREDRQASAGWSGSRMEGRSSTGAQVLPGHTLLVESVLFSPDGRTLASCGWDCAVRLWDLTRQAAEPDYQPMVLPHDSVRLAMAFSPDGNLLAATGAESVAVWHCKRTATRPLLEQRSATYRAVAFSPDSRMLALAGDDRVVRLLEIPSGRILAALVGHEDIVRNAIFSRDGRRLITSTQFGEILVWDPASRVKVGTIRARGSEMMQTATLSPDGQTLAISGLSFSPREVLLLDSETGVVKQRLAGHAKGINSISYTADGRVLATGGVDQCIKLWDVESGRELSTISDGAGWIKSVALSPDGHYLAHSGQDLMVRIREVNANASLPAAASNRSSIAANASSPNPVDAS
jgi:WD40 repeat protein